jgi:uncharacterized protein (TIGR02271 family)
VDSLAGEDGMITRDSIQRVLGVTAVDRAGDKIGRVGNIYVDDSTGEPEWMTVHTGRFGRRETLVPLQPVELRDGEVVVPFEKERVVNAPNVDVRAAAHLSEQDEARLYEYYSMSQPGAPAGSAIPPTDNAMTRSEEELRVGKKRREAGRVHLRKYVVTEEEQRTVPVRKETVRLEREPITDANRAAAMSGPDIAEADHEVIRHEEEPVVSTKTVPKERVRLTTDETTEQQTVGGKVRKERIAVEGLDEDQGR